MNKSKKKKKKKTSARKNYFKETQAEIGFFSDKIDLIVTWLKNLNKDI